MRVPSYDGINPMSRGRIILFLEMKTVQIPVKHVAMARALRGLTKIFTSFHLNSIRIQSPDALPFSMFTYGLPYEATETYRTIRNEFESNKSLAILEARSALSRC
jgi:hypothetical protein